MDNTPNAEPCIIQSAFQLENQRRIIVYTSGSAIKSFNCDENWKTMGKPFGECPLEWSGKTATEYHLHLRNKIHKPEHFVPEQSTILHINKPSDLNERVELMQDLGNASGRINKAVNEIYKVLTEETLTDKILKEMNQEQVFELYHKVKDRIGELGYNNFIHTKEVEEYRKWLREDKYKHRLEWFEKKYPNGLYYKDEDQGFVGIRIITKIFLAEADAAFNALSEKEVEREIEAEANKRWPISKFGWICNSIHKRFMEAAMFGFKLKTKGNGKD
jgi:hypothetical protein